MKGPKAPKQKSTCMTLSRKFTTHGQDPFKSVRYVRVSSSIRDVKGKPVFEMKDVEAPEEWSQLAIDILASKYFRRTGVPRIGQENSIKQVIKRITGSIRKHGEKQKLLSGENARVFEAELQYLLLHQMAAFNSPVWFNVGLWDSYRIKGSGGSFRFDSGKKKVLPVSNAFQYPQASACFIQSLDDDLMAIFDLVKTEAKLFKYGSGTGTNFSKLRGKQERLSGGGLSSGLMSFLEVLDRSAGATKSGGTTRRAAKMVCLDVDHPEILDFIDWKAKEERKAKVLIEAGYSSDFNGEAYRTIAGQNSNNSVRVTDEFMNAVLEDREWQTHARTNGEVVETMKAREIWKRIAQASWTCADPGLQFDDTIQQWHTCKKTDRIQASNPCSEFMFLDDTACNLASINLLKFLNPSGGFDSAAFCHSVRILIVAQEILVGMSSYPSEKIAQNAHTFRPLGLGYANLGTLLMVKGLPYDSKEGRECAAAITALMTGEAYAVSSEIAMHLGAFQGYAKNKSSMNRVIEDHLKYVSKLNDSQGVGTSAKASWARAQSLGRRFGFRNAQVTVLAPTGTIGLLMDCDTTGIEPDFSLIKFKKLAGGGSVKIVNQSVSRSLQALGYGPRESKSILDYALGTLKLSDGTAEFNDDILIAKGLNADDLAQLEKGLVSAYHLADGFSSDRLGEAALSRLGLSGFTGSGMELLHQIGFSNEVIEAASLVICGRMTLEGAPGLHPNHQSVFDCANRCGIQGTRSISPFGHLAMMEAVQPFLSGAISKTVNLPESTSVEEIEAIHLMAWKMGLKSIAVYRDGCKSSQPLNSSTQKSKREVERERLPEKRQGITLEARVGGNKVYIRTGEYRDGRLGELFLDIEKEDPEYRALLRCFAIAISLGLQHGVPLKDWVDRFAFTQFDPSGPVSGHPNLRLATSLIDYVFRTLGLEYLGRGDLAHISTEQKLERTERRGDAIDDQLSALMSDAPKCDACGHETVRNGACFRCLHCGNSMGCS